MMVKPVIVKPPADWGEYIRQFPGRLDAIEKKLAELVRRHKREDKLHESMNTTDPNDPRILSMRERD